MTNEVSGNRPVTNDNAASRNNEKKSKECRSNIIFHPSYQKKNRWVFCSFKPNNLLIMKKVLIALVLILAVLVVNAQATKTPVVKEKPIRAAVMVGDLQKTVTDNIAKDYVGFTIKEAFSLTEKDLVTYEVVIVKGTTAETLVYDKNGIFIKKIPQEFVKPTDPKKK